MWLCCCYEDLPRLVLLSLCGSNNEICLWYFQRFPRQCNHSNVHLKWKTISFDLDTFGSEYLAFDSSCYTFWATCVNAIDEKVQVTWKVFINLVEDAKSWCLGFFLPFSLFFFFLFLLKSSFIFLLFVFYLLSLWCLTIAQNLSLVSWLQSFWHPIWWMLWEFIIHNNAFKVTLMRILINI
jgi:hypothetical protein